MPRRTSSLASLCTSVSSVCYWGNDQWQHSTNRVTLFVDAFLFPSRQAMYRCRRQLHSIVAESSSAPHWQWHTESVSFHVQWIYTGKWYRQPKYQESDDTIINGYCGHIHIQCKANGRLSRVSMQKEHQQQQKKRLPKSEIVRWMVATCNRLRYFVVCIAQHSTGSCAAHLICE